MSKVINDSVTMSGKKNNRHYHSGSVSPGKDYLEDYTGATTKMKEYKAKNKPKSVLDSQLSPGSSRDIGVAGSGYLGRTGKLANADLQQSRVYDTAGEPAEGENLDPFELMREIEGIKNKRRQEKDRIARDAKGARKGGELSSAAGIEGIPEEERAGESGRGQRKY